MHLALQLRIKYKKSYKIYAIGSPHIFFGFIFFGLKQSIASYTVVGMITAAQCRAARGLLGWNQADLAEFAGIATVTVHQFEAGAAQPRRSTVDVIRRAFESAGILFIDENGEGPGVRLRKRVLKKPR
jgi:DNA-binding XRE family transcriptional regulator